MSTKIPVELAGFIKALAVISFFVFGLLLIISIGRTLFPPAATPFDTVVHKKYKYINVGSMEDLELALKQNNLWEIKAGNKVSPVIFDRYPVGIVTLSVKTRKKIFFNTLLPGAMIVQAEVARERRRLKNLIGKLEKAGFQLSEIIFDQNRQDWQEVLSDAHIKKALQLAQKYRETSAEALLVKIDVIPVSLILAQAAIESAWGCSRFSIAGNNIFGIWTWGDDGLVPTLRKSGLNHKVKTFDSLMESIKAYTLMINRLPAYERLRVIRKGSKDAIDLAEGLINYSSRRNLYVMDVKKMIRLNKLRALDTLVLARNTDGKK